MQTKRPEALRFRVFLARREGFEPPAFWSVGCLKGKSESFRLRFVLFAAVRSADLPLFPSRPVRFFRVLGQKWVKRGAPAPTPTAPRSPLRRRRQPDRPRRPLQRTVVQLPQEAVIRPVGRQRLHDVKAAVMSDFRFQPWPETIAITTLLEFCSWLQHNRFGGGKVGCELFHFQKFPILLTPAS